MKDAFTQPQRTGTGCQHFQGNCRCDVPYHLRASSLTERRRELRKAQPSENESLYREMLAKVLDRSIPHTLRQQIIKLLNQP